jgi:hypothetical protein
MNRRLLALLVVGGCLALVLLINRFTQERPAAWAQLAGDGCRAGRFALPPSILPPELARLLGDAAVQRDREIRSEFLTSVHEFAGEAFSGVPLNINCERSAYDPTSLNIYFVADDPDQRFSWSKGLILTRSDASRVIVFGPEFWDFFAQAWKPIWDWRNRTSNRDFLSALGGYDADIYLFYLEWAVAHEMGHIRLGHHSPKGLWLTQEDQGVELAADIEAARIMRRQYHLISGYLLGLVNETMKAGFYETYHREWQQGDGDPLRSDWKLHAVQCDRSHPPFVIRSLSMLEAAGRVSQDQREEIEKQKEEGIKKALSENNDIESQIQIEQMLEADKPAPKLSPQYASEIELAQWVRTRIIIERPVFGLCFDKLPSFLRSPSTP